MATIKTPKRKSPFPAKTAPRNSGIFSGNGSQKNDGMKDPEPAVRAAAMKNTIRANGRTLIDRG